MSLALLFHKYTKGLLRINPTPLDLHTWPESWTAVQYKEYPRMPRVPLPAVTPPTSSLAAAIIDRHSAFTFDQTTSVTVEHLAALLRHGAGIKPNQEETELEHKMRVYPSGGARYPLELYVATAGTKELPCGLYHFHVPTNSLEEVGGHFAFKAVRAATNYAFAQTAPTLLIITSVWKRNFERYHDFGYPVIHLEAGHLAQNLLLLATALGIKTRPLAGYQLQKLSEALDLDEHEESPIHMLVLGEP